MRTWIELRVVKSVTVRVVLGHGGASLACALTPLPERCEMRLLLVGLATLTAARADAWAEYRDALLSPVYKVRAESVVGFASSQLLTLSISTGIAGLRGDRVRVSL